MLLIFLVALICASVRAEEEDGWTVPDSVFQDFRLTYAQKHFAIKEARKRVKELRASLGEGRLDLAAQRTDEALNNAILRGVRALKEAGDVDGAYQIEFEWNTQWKGSVVRLLSRDIGDHKPLFDWLDTVYNRIVSVIGVTAAKALHLSDLYTWNHTLPVVFKPCSFPMDSVLGTRKDEYKRHFDQGLVYYGLLPVDTYWILFIAIEATTSGIGTFFAGPIAMAGEFIMGQYIAGPISDKVYSMACE